MRVKVRAAMIGVTAYVGHAAFQNFTYRLIKSGKDLKMIAKQRHWHHPIRWMKRVEAKKLGQSVITANSARRCTSK